MLNDLLKLDDLTQKKRKVLLDNGEGKLKCAVICPTELSPSKDYIRLGQFFSDEVSGWYPVDFVRESVREVLQEF